MVKRLKLFYFNRKETNCRLERSTEYSIAERYSSIFDADIWEMSHFVLSQFCVTPNERTREKRKPLSGLGSHTIEPQSVQSRPEKKIISVNREVQQKRL